MRSKQKKKENHIFFSSFHKKNSKPFIFSSSAGKHPFISFQKNRTSDYSSSVLVEMVAVSKERGYVECFCPSRADFLSVPYGLGVRPLRTIFILYVEMGLSF